MEDFQAPGFGFWITVLVNIEGLRRLTSLRGLKVGWLLQTAANSVHQPLEPLRRFSRNL